MDLGDHAIVAMASVFGGNLTYRGKTEVERGFEDFFAARGFEDFFAARGIAVRITFRDLALDMGGLPRFVEEIRRDRPDLV